MDRSIISSRAVAGIVALIVSTACSERPSEPTTLSPLSSASRTVVASPAGRYLVLAKGNGFRDDFASSVTTLGGTVETAHQGAGFAVVSGLTADAAASLAGNSGVAEVDADEIVALDAPIAATQADASAVTNPTATSILNPAGAILFSWQWNMRAIGANTAWAHGKLGDPGVTVAILDTGIDYDALDLNGLVDFSRSTSFSASDNHIRSSFFPSRNNISDFNGHGTNVATMVSSKAVAFAGVTSRTTLIGVKVLGQDGSGSFGDILNGVLYAADHGADVANMSLGGGFTKAGNGRLTSTLNRVFNYAKKSGMLIVVAAGTTGRTSTTTATRRTTFCDMVHVVCVSAIGPVTATGPVDLPAFYTNFGRSSISVAGPGGNADPNGSRVELALGTRLRLVGLVALQQDAHRGVHRNRNADFDFLCRRESADRFHRHEPGNAARGGTRRSARERERPWPAAADQAPHREVGGRSRTTRYGSVLRERPHQRRESAWILSVLE